MKDLAKGNQVITNFNALGDDWTKLQSRLKHRDLTVFINVFA